MTKVILSSDWHLGGSKESNFEEIYKIAKRYWKNKPVILLGDLIDMGIDRGMQFNSSLQPQEQIDYVFEILPLLNVKGYCIGNHEKRIFKYVGINPYEKLLGRQSHEVTIDDVKFYYNHGKSTAQDIFGEHKKFLQSTNADVIALGHNHSLAVRYVLRDKQHICLLRTGCLSGDLQYAIDDGYPNQIKGFVEYDTEKNKARLFTIIDNGKIQVL